MDTAVPQATIPARLPVWKVALFALLATATFLVILWTLVTRQPELFFTRCGFVKGELQRCTGSSVCVKDRERAEAFCSPAFVAVRKTSHGSAHEAAEIVFPGQVRDSYTGYATECVQGYYCQGFGGDEGGRCALDDRPVYDLR